MITTFREIPLDDMILAVRAVKWLSARPEHDDAILFYGEAPNEKKFYVYRRKASIVVRPA